MEKKLKLDQTSGIFRDYRAAIHCDEQAGAKSSITYSDFTKSLDRSQKNEI